MSLTDTLKIVGLVASVPATAYLINLGRKKFVDWAEKNKFYDEDVLKTRMDDEITPKTNYSKFAKTAAFYKPFSNLK